MLYMHSALKSEKKFNLGKPQSLPQRIKSTFFWRKKFVAEGPAV